jgi:hypothetical protein
VNPRIPADYAEVGRWLRLFATSHAKREDPRIEAHVETDGEREGRSYGLGLVLGPGSGAPVSALVADLAYPEVVQGRTRFAWCEAQARRVREAARALVAGGQGRASRSA